MFPKEEHIQKTWALQESQQEAMVISYSNEAHQTLEYELGTNS